MATVEALKKALTETLESKGILGELKARVRTEVFKALDDPTSEKPRLSNENLLINDLIREYLIFNNYKYTDSVLVAETGQPDVQLQREFLCQELNVQDSETSVQVPLLYSLLDNFTNRHSVRNFVKENEATDDDLSATEQGVLMKGVGQK